MTTTGQDHSRTLRAVYDDFRVGEQTVAMISDPLNERAWIHSTEAVDVEE